VILHQAKQIFQIAASCLQHLHNLKDGRDRPESLGESIETYKIQLGKYHKILLYELKETEGESGRSQVFSEAVLADHKSKLLKAKEIDNNVENIIEVLLSLRVHALQISPELRRHLVNELIKADIFYITHGVPASFTALKKAISLPVGVAPMNNFVLDLLDNTTAGLRHAICAMISVVASTAKGVDYLT
jgi:hypothetical protein